MYWLDTHSLKKVFAQRQYLDLLGLNGEYNQRLIREVSLSAKTVYLGERRYLWIRRPTSQQLTINHLDRERLWMDKTTYIKSLPVKSYALPLTTCSWDKVFRLKHNLLEKSLPQWLWIETGSLLLLLPISYVKSWDKDKDCEYPRWWNVYIVHTVLWISYQFQISSSRAWGHM